MNAFAILEDIYLAKTSVICSMYNRESHYTSSSLLGLAQRVFNLKQLGDC